MSQEANPEMDPPPAQAGVLTEAPPGAEPRTRWPEADTRKQVNIEHSFFEEDATIRFEQLRPMQAWAPLVGLTNARRTNFVVTHVVRTAMAGKTRLRQEEIDAIADTAARNYNRSAWIRPVAAGITGGIIYGNRADYRFPLYTPSRSWFNPEVFVTNRVAVLRGNLAKVAWHTIRFSAYFLIIAPATAFFYVSISRTSISAALFRDPRLSRVKKEVMDHMPKNPNQPGRAPQPQAPRQQMDPSDIQRRDESYRRVGLPPPPAEDFTHMERRSADQWQSQDAEQSAEWGSEQAPRQRGGMFGRWGATPTSQPATQEQPKQPEQSSLWDDSDLLDDDDTSPVSAAARRAELAGRSPGQGGSAWDRVRQQAKASASPFARGDRSKGDTAWGQLQQDAAPTERDRDRTPPSQSYTYSQSDSEDDAAKRKAQKEFDDMLEAERKGEGNSRRRW